MSKDQGDLIRLFEAELDRIEGGGYGRRAGMPLEHQPIFYHSLVCINHWLVPGHEPECCEGCVLLSAVPEKYRSEKQPCWYIPLNEKGDTVKSLESEGDREQLEEAVKSWLRSTLEQMRAGSSPLDSPDVQF